MARLTGQQMDRAKQMHDECMKDPEYAAKWNALTAELFTFLADLPEDALPDDSNSRIGRREERR